MPRQQLPLELIYQVFALLIAFILVHGVYVTVIRPQADAFILEEQARIVDRTFYIVNPDEETSILARSVLRADAFEYVKANMSGIAEGKIKKAGIKVDDVAEYLGPVKLQAEAKARMSTPGVAMGLAWTPFGGDLLFIEATSMKGKKGLTLTGQLGDVMKESATAALSFIRANAKKLGVDEDYFDTHDIHIHVPAGAIPKDGPSAGVAMLTALVTARRERLPEDFLAGVIYASDQTHHSVLKAALLAGFPDAAGEHGC